VSSTRLSSAGASNPILRRNRGLATVCKSVQLTNDSAYLVRPDSGPIGMCVVPGPAVPVTTAMVTAANGSAMRFTVSTTTGCGPTGCGRAQLHTSPRRAVPGITTGRRRRPTAPRRSRKSLRPEAARTRRHRRHGCQPPHRSPSPLGQVAEDPHGARPTWKPGVGSASLFARHPSRQPANGPVQPEWRLPVSARQSGRFLHAHASFLSAGRPWRDVAVRAVVHLSYRQYGTNADLEGAASRSSRHAWRQDHLVRDRLTFFRSGEARLRHPHAQRW
jgi:hypothetical protein